MTTTLTAVLKSEWQAAAFTPEEDDEDLALECEQVRKVIEEGTFPTHHELVGDFISFFSHKEDQWYLVETIVVYATTVYESVAKIMYAMHTDAFEEKARAIGQKLYDVGGLKLMQCAYYALSQTASSMTEEVYAEQKDLHHLYSVFASELSYAFNGVGGWQV